MVLSVLVNAYSHVTTTIKVQRNSVASKTFLFPVQSTPPLIPSPWKPLFCFYTVSAGPQTRQHSCSLLSMASLTQHNASEILPRYYCGRSFLLIAQEYSVDEYTTVFSPIHQLRDIGLLLVWGSCMQIQQLQAFTLRFLCEHSFYFISPG